LRIFASSADSSAEFWQGNDEGNHSQWAMFCDGNDKGNDESLPMIHHSQAMMKGIIACPSSFPSSLPSQNSLHRSLSSL